jgi:hypothetical protein
MIAPYPPSQGTIVRHVCHLRPEAGWDLTRSFRRSARAVYDVGDGYMVNELVDGEPLRGAKPGLRKTIELAAQTASGLAAPDETVIVRTGPGVAGGRPSQRHF